MPLPLRCTHQDRHGLQGAGDGEREVQDARRRQHRPADAGGAAAHRESPHGAWRLRGEMRELRRLMRGVALHTARLGAAAGRDDQVCGRQMG